ncbi:MAG: hypothetical protein MZV64_15220 [Ignavibacteriales bacterium]|nr:hypothetical protein [Ignavibacteriales bacterium]
MNVAPSKSVKAFIKSASVKDYQLDYIKKLARVEEIQVSEMDNASQRQALQP